MHPIFHQQVVGPRIHNQPGDQSAIDATLHKAGPEAFSYLESLAPDSFLVGNQLSIADLAVVSNLLVYHYLGHRIDRYPRLNVYFQRHLDSSLIRDAVQSERPFADNMGLDRSFLG